MSTRILKARTVTVCDYDGTPASVAGLSRGPNNFAFAELGGILVISSPNYETDLWIEPGTSVMQLAGWYLPLSREAVDDLCQPPTRGTLA